MTKIAFIGCGNVADSYAKTLANYPELTLVGVYDVLPERMHVFTSRWPCRRFKCMNELLHDDTINIVLNLTNPREHYDINKECLLAGKHIYSEKPLAMNSSQAHELVKLANENGLRIGCAPCSVLSQSAQTLWKAIRDGLVGKVRLVHGNFDDGMIAPKLEPWRWQNALGVPWPAKDEFEVGCTYEHAGYILTWLASFFGPAIRVTSFAKCLIPDKGIEVNAMAPDYTVGCIEYTEGIVARVTCSLIAPRDKSLTIIGDDGVLMVSNVRNDICPVYFGPFSMPPRWHKLERIANVLRRTLQLRKYTEDWQYWRKLQLVRHPAGRFVSRSKRVDFCRGLADMAEAIADERNCRLSGELGAHVVEIIEALQFPERFGGMRSLHTTFQAPIPLF